MLVDVLGFMSACTFGVLIDLGSLLNYGSESSYVLDLILSNLYSCLTYKLVGNNFTVMSCRHHYLFITLFLSPSSVYFVHFGNVRLLNLQTQ